MDSTTTVADAKTALARFSYTDAEALRKLNRVGEHLLKSEVYTDIFSIVEFAASTGIITMPRHLGRAHGVQDDKLNKPIFSQHVEWIECGIGRQDPAQMNLDGLIDLGSHFCTQSDVLNADGVEQSGTLRVKVENVADQARVFRFFGTDADGKRIFDTSGNLGLNLTMAGASADTAQVFTEVQGIQAPVTTGRWTLWKVIAAVETQIGSYEPGETRPRYVRYKTRVTTAAIRLFCRRKHVPYVADTDFVYPDNLDATEHGFNALTFRDKGSFKTEEECWEQAKNVLKTEYAWLKAPIRMFLTSDNFGSPGPVPRTI